jgi:transcription initiation factor TFIID subunit 3
MDAQKFHHALLRNSVLQVLRAAGFQSARPQAVEALTEIASLYLRQLAEFGVAHAAANHNDAIPDLSDVRLAMASCGAFGEHWTPAQEAWKEVLRKPLSSYPEMIRENERAKRDAEDTREITDWIAGATGLEYKEISRIAGWMSDEDALKMAVAATTEEEKPRNEDYITGSYE